MLPDSQKTVLVIDDSEIVLELVRETLETAGLRVQTRRGPQGSVNAVLREKPSLVLLDVNMPSLTGDAIAKIISRSETRPDTIILLHSSLPPQTLRLKAISTGADGFIQKTEDQQHLLQEVLAWLSGVRSRGISSRSIPVVEEVAPTVPVEASICSVLFVDDDPATLTFCRQSVVEADMVGNYLASHLLALHQARSDSPPDVIVSGVLQNRRGIELYRSLRELDSTWQFRFVLLSSTPIEDFGVPVLRKPIEAERLRSTIRHSMTRVRFLRARARLTT